MPILTINAPSGAVTSVNGMQTDTFEAEVGTNVKWSVFLSDSGTREGELVLNRDTVLDVRIAEGSFNINFLTNEAFDALGTPEPNGIYAVECDPVVDFFPKKEDVLSGLSDGNSWYRVHKSGWVEQGGLSEAVPADGALSITLLKPMLNNVYTVLGGVVSSNVLTPVASGVCASNLTTTSFQIDLFNGTASFPVWWKVVGQGA